MGRFKMPFATCINLVIIVVKGNIILVSVS